MPRISSHCSGADYVEVRGENLARAVNQTADLASLLPARAPGKGKGVLVRLENLSSRYRLGSPQQQVRCGWADRELGQAAALPPRTADLVLFHNRGKRLRSSCGSISWQLQVRVHYSVRRYCDNMKTGRGGAAGSGRVETGPDLEHARHRVGGDLLRPGPEQPGQLACTGLYCTAVQLAARWVPVPLDSQGREVGWDQETVYTAHHQAGQQDTTVLEGGVAGVLAESPGGAVEVRATITTGCLATLNLTLVDSEPGQRDMQADEIWEQMVRQAWRDIVLTVNRDRALYGVGLAPLELDPLLPQQLTVNTDLAGYAVTLALWNITVTTPLLLQQFYKVSLQVEGADKIELARLELERGPALASLQERADLTMEQLTIRGTYRSPVLLCSHP